MWITEQKILETEIVDKNETHCYSRCNFPVRRDNSTKANESGTMFTPSLYFLIQALKFISFFTLFN